MTKLRSIPYALAGAAFALATAALADVPPPDPAPPYQPDPPATNGAAPAPAPDASSYGPTNGADVAGYPVDAPEAAFNWTLWGGIALVAVVAIVAIVLMRRRKP